MINILSYLGMNMQSEVCLWTLLGLLRTIFDATLFKVNANLKQVWQVTMPDELSMSVQRVLRTMISGVILVQCFTVYVYLASYIVLLYPVFLEERPTLVLPWLLLAAIRKLLCELTSLALGLGTCVLLGPARSSCIKFVIVKVVSIMPSFYMWMLVFSYYHALKVASAFKTFPVVLPPSDHDYGLELAVRRRRTKSLLGEEQLRKKLVAHFYNERLASDTTDIENIKPKLEIPTRMVHSTDMSFDDQAPDLDTLQPAVSNRMSHMTQAYEDWFGSEIIIPRDTDRILEQFILMLLRIAAYLKNEGVDSIHSQFLNSRSSKTMIKHNTIEGPVLPAEDTETPPQVGSRGNTASYLREYPQIFMKRQSSEIPVTERKISSIKTVHSHIQSIDGNTIRNCKRVISISSNETISMEVNKMTSKRKIASSSRNVSQKHDKFSSPRQMRSKALDIKNQSSTIEDQSGTEQPSTKENLHVHKAESQSKDSSSSAMVSSRAVMSESKKSSKQDKNKEIESASSSRNPYPKRRRSKTDKSLKTSKKTFPEKHLSDSSDKGETDSNKSKTSNPYKKHN